MVNGSTKYLETHPRAERKHALSVVSVYVPVPPPRPVLIRSLHAPSVESSSLPSLKKLSRDQHQRSADDKQDQPGPPQHNEADLSCLAGVAFGAVFVVE